MLDLNFAGDGPLNILCLGAHCDDIEIGCGGMLLELLASGRQIHCTWVTFCSNETRALEATNSAERFLAKATGKTVEIYRFDDGFLPYVGAEVKKCFENLKTKLSPDLILTHYHADKHQDHRLVSELTYNTFRDHLILEYEIPKYDGDMGQPNSFFPISRVAAESKVQFLLDAYGTQGQKHWFSEEVFMGLLRLRGMEINSGSGLAEGFYCTKIRLG